MVDGYTDLLANYDRENNPVLDVIYELESSSGKNKEAYKKNQYGAMGGYQIRDITFKDLQRQSPDKWGKLSFEEVASDDRLSRVAASDYLSWIEEYLVNHGISPSIENILLSYHSGVGNVRKGKIGKEGLEYINRAHRIMFPELFQGE